MVAVLDTLELPVALERGDRFRGMVRKALGMLDNPGGFFLMIEGSCIDDWCHANRIDRAVEETLDFDRTVGDVLRWAAADGETLVVVTADHATGGLTLLDGNLAEGLVRVNFASEGHNGILVPVFAYGPRAAGVYGYVRELRTFTQNRPGNGRGVMRRMGGVVPAGAAFGRLRFSRSGSPNVRRIGGMRRILRTRR